MLRHAVDLVVQPASGNGVRQFLSGAVAGVVVIICIHIISEPRVDQPTRAVQPYLLKPSGPLEGLCRYITTLRQDDHGSELSPGSSAPIVMRRGESSYIAVSLSEGFRSFEPMVADSVDINGTQGLLTTINGYLTLKWRIGQVQLESYGISSTAELLAVAQSVRLTFDENGARFESVDPGSFRPDGNLRANRLAYGTIVYDDCRRSNRRSRNSPRPRLITLATSPKLSDAELTFAMTYGKSAVMTGTSKLRVNRSGTPVELTQTVAVNDGQTLRFVTWVEHGAQVSVASAGFSDELVRDFISKLTVASSADYRKMRPIAGS